MRFALQRSPVWVAGLVMSAALVGVGWVDYQATRRELIGLLRDQAWSLSATLAASARANRAAAREAERQLERRLLDNARLLGELDRRRALDQGTLEEIARSNQLFRATVFDAWGRREFGGSGVGVGGGGPRGPGGGGGPGRGSGPRAGGGAGATTPGGGLGPGAGREVLERLLSGDPEATGELHPSRGRASDAARLVAGVRRARGGAIVLVADASSVDELQRPYSLDALLGDISDRNDELAYVVLEVDGLRLSHGVEAAEVPEPGAAPVEGGIPAVAEREIALAGQPVLEIAGPFSLEGAERATLRLGMRLDGVRRAERQTAIRLAASLATALVLTLVALGFVSLRRQYGRLSERHAAAEEALRRRDRLTAMGELASTVAHEVRNPLNAIAMTARRLRREFLTSAPLSAPTAQALAEPDPELVELIDVLEREIQRINGIVHQFLEFARPPALVRRTADLGQTTMDAVDALRPLAAARGVTLTVEPDAAGPAFVDPDQLRHAIDNLVRNAIEATPADGRVHVAVRSGHGEQTIEVRDTGSGIPPEHQSRIFNLYFTTKPDGTGVGLAVAHQIVTAHDGLIEVDSQPGTGTRMTIRLPRGHGGPEGV